MTEFLVPVGTLIVGALLTFTATWFWKQAEKRSGQLNLANEAREALLDRVNELEKQLAIVQVSVTPISAAYQAMLVKQLTHFHTPELDALMAKLGPPNMLTPEEGVRMSILLQARVIDMGSEIDDSERDAAAMLPLVIRRVAVESAAIAVPKIVQTVAIPKMQIIDAMLPSVPPPAINKAKNQP